MTRSSTLTSVVTVLVALSAVPTGLNAAGKPGDETRVLVLDVAIDARTMSFANNDPSDPANPRRGSTFVVYGKVFPGGTIPSGVTPFDPNQPGSIGSWICRGVFLADIADIFSGTASLTVDTTQVFLLTTDSNTVMTEGLEGNVGVTTHRAVTGGTGRYRGVTGSVRQQNIGVNRNGASDGLFDLRFTFTIEADE
jgi:hypothetical protein